MNDHNPNALDREFGTFGAMGASALQEGVAIYYQDILDAERRETTRRLNQEADDYNEIVDDYNELKSKFLKLVENHNKLVDSHNSLLEQRCQLSNQIHNLREENEDLRTVAINRENNARALSLEKDGEVEKWRELFELAQSAKTQSDIASTKQFAKSNDQITNYALFTKVLYTQRKALVAALFEVFKPSKVQFDELVRVHHKYLSMNDIDDLKDDKITYSQSLNTLMRKKAFTNHLHIWTSTQTFQKFE